MVPMQYATHVVSPCLGLLDARAEYVVLCFPLSYSLIIHTKLRVQDVLPKSTGRK